MTWRKITFHVDEFRVPHYLWVILQYFIRMSSGGKRAAITSPALLAVGIFYSHSANQYVLNTVLLGLSEHRISNTQTLQFTDKVYPLQTQKQEKTGRGEERRFCCKRSYIYRQLSVSSQTKSHLCLLLILANYNAVILQSSQTLFHLEKNYIHFTNFPCN